jgi:A/G-specific adenine glycosylase
MFAEVAPLKQKPAREFRDQLQRWYGNEQRALPWRGESDPYRILVSEIMLQQTRVAVVEERYRQFLRRFPDVTTLARAREQSVLAAWSGLGYYRRARSLHAAARQIVRDERFPQTSREMLELPGVGRYTANAVASIAFGEPVPVVDGNVKRVLARFSGHSLSDDQCWRMAADLLDVAQPGDFNQAMMELGALVCLPRQPLCSQCPVETLCASRSAGPGREPAPRRKGVLNYALVLRNSSVLLEQRPHTASLMPDMWELPVLDAVKPGTREPLLRLRHAITTTDYSVFVYALERRPSRKGRWVALASSERLPLTGLTRKILRRLTEL